MSKIRLIIIGFIIGILLGLLLVSKMYATQSESYKTICHHNPANNITLSFQNQQSYNGHLGTPHSDQVYDTEGECEEEVELTPTPCIRISPTVTPTPEPEEEITPTVTVAPTVEPTEAPKAGGWSPQPEVFTDGRHTKDDGLGCGAHECKAEVLHSCDIPGNCGWK